MELAREVKVKLDLAHSSIVLVAPEQIDESAQQIASIAAAAGFTPVVVSTRTPPEQISFDTGHEFVFVVQLRGPITERIARSLKHLADDFRSNRVGLVLPNGLRIEQRVRIHCSFTVVSQEFRNWPASLKKSFIDYYSVLDFRA